MIPTVCTTSRYSTPTARSACRARSEARTSPRCSITLRSTGASASSVDPTITGAARTASADPSVAAASASRPSAQRRRALLLDVRPEERRELDRVVGRRTHAHPRQRHRVELRPEPDRGTALLTDERPLREPPDAAAVGRAREAQGVDVLAGGAHRDRHQPVPVGQQHLALDDALGHVHHPEVLDDPERARRGCVAPVDDLVEGHAPSSRAAGARGCGSRRTVRRGRPSAGVTPARRPGPARPARSRRG